MARAALTQLMITVSARQARFNTLPFAERCEQSLRLLIDIELMAHADYFVGAHPSRQRSV